MSVFHEKEKAYVRLRTGNSPDLNSKMLNGRLDLLMACMHEGYISDL